MKRNSTVASREQLLRIINEDYELLPKSKDMLTFEVRHGHIETFEQLNRSIAHRKRADGTNSNSTLTSPEQLLKIINEDTELLPKSKEMLIFEVRNGHTETIEQLNRSIAHRKRADGTRSNSTLTSPEQLLRIINEDTELLPKSKEMLIFEVRNGHTETIEQLNLSIAHRKRADGTNSNSTLTSPEQLLKIINEDTELLPKSKEMLIFEVRNGHTETIEQLNRSIAHRKRADGTRSNSTLTSPEQLLRIINEDTELLPKSKEMLIFEVRNGHTETIEQLNRSIAHRKRVDGRL